MMLPGNQRPLFNIMPNPFHQQTGQSLNQPVSMQHTSHQMSVVKSEPMPRIIADLYLCDSGNSDIREKDMTESSTSIDLLDKEHKMLTQTKIKDALSSFVPDIPGEFDSSNNPDSMLRTLIDRPPIGGREFLPLSDQSLLGFRLHPGQLPEQYRLDPLSLLSESTQKYTTKKKKKHKHKHVDKTEESSLTNYSPSVSREHSPPGDPCDFIKPENTQSFFPAHPQQRPSAHHSSSQSSQQPSGIPSQSHLIQGMGPTGPGGLPHSSNIIQPNSITPSGAFLGNMVSSSMSSTQTPSVIVQPNKMSAYQQQMQAYAAASGVPGAIGNPNMMSTAGMKIPAKPKKKRHNVEGPEGQPKKKKKKDKDKEKSKEKKKKKHHNLDGVQSSVVPGSLTPAPPGSTPVTIATSATPNPLSMSSQFTAIHPSTNQ